MNKNGLLAELKFLSWLIERGITNIAFPITEQGLVDIVWEISPGKWVSGQIKKVYSRRGKPTIDLVHRSGNSRRRYEPQDADFVVAVDTDRIWIIPMDIVCQFKQLNLSNPKLRLKGFCHEYCWK